MYSSNLGSARMAMEAGAERQRSFLGRLGLLKPVPIELDEVAQAALPAARMARGQRHHDRLRPRHLGDAAACDHRGLGGRQRRHPAPADAAQIAARSDVPPGERVISPEDLRADAQADAAGRAVRHRQVRRRAGLCRRRQDRHGGKEHRRPLCQQKKLLSDFVGAFPMHDPRYAILITGRRAARHEEELRLCHGRVDRGAGDEPHHPAHRADSRGAAGRRGIAGGGSGVGGREFAGKAG